MRNLANPGKSWSLAISVLLRLYLGSFLIVACAPRRPPVSVVEARSMETRTIGADYEKVMKASINVLQDLRYTVDVIDNDLGLIVASRVTEGREADLALEPDQKPEYPTWQKVLGFTIIIAIIGGIIWLITRGGDKETDTGRDRDRGGRDTHVYHSSDRTQESWVYQYKITLNIESLNPEETSLRVSGAGERRRGSSIEQAGPIEDPEFFQRFFTSLDKALFLEN